MRKNRLFILGIFTVMVALVSLSLVSGTWAKYTSTVSGSDSARVAKWEWNYKGAKVTTENVSFDLFGTIYEEDTTSTENHVVSGLIAPGTGGSFAISFENESEVTATMNVTFSQTETSDIPVEFSFDKNFATGTVKTNIADLSWSEVLSVNSTAVEKTVYWRWAYNVGNDANDTALGAKGTDTITVSMSVVFTQVD